MPAVTPEKGGSGFIKNDKSLRNKNINMKKMKLCISAPVYYTEYKLETTEYKLETTEYKLKPTEYDIENTEYELKPTEYEIETTEYELKPTEYKLMLK